ncbi:hypothetical protein Hanom_Chr00s000390g01641681 [Helianthus anomalus]
MKTCRHCRRHERRRRFFSAVISLSLLSFPLSVSPLSLSLSLSPSSLSSSVPSSPHHHRTVVVICFGSREKGGVTTSRQVCLSAPEMEFRWPGFSERER